jgi:hypothetical protein
MLDDKNEMYMHGVGMAGISIQECVALLEFAKTGLIHKVIFDDDKEDQPWKP